MAMLTTSRAIIEAPIERAWAILSNYSNDTHWRKAFAWRVGGGSIAKGSRRLVALEACWCELVLEKHLTLAGADRLLQSIIAFTVRRTERADAWTAAASIASSGANEA